MSRTETYTALVLRTHNSGESNREAWFLTEEAGLLKATVFGGPKSKLRSHVSPHNSGKLWIYRDPVRNSRKVSDFDVRSWRPGIRELWERIMAASAIAETILSSQGGGGNWAEAFLTACRSLDALDDSDGEFSGRIFIHFLWNWLDILGSRPDLEHCVSCACEPGGDRVLWYDGIEGGVFCADCARGRESGTLLRLGPGAGKWLRAAARSAPLELKRCSLDTVSRAEARHLVTALMSHALGRGFSSWENVR
jgi:DNA repair protein RecO (recombination protein O)